MRVCTRTEAKLPELAQCSGVYRACSGATICDTNLNWGKQTFFDSTPRLLILLESFFNFGPFLSSSCFHNPPPETVCILLTAPTLSPSHTAAVWLYLTDGFVNVGVGRTYRCILNVSHNESTLVRYYPEVLT